MLDGSDELARRRRQRRRKALVESFQTVPYASKMSNLLPRAAAKNRFDKVRRRLPSSDH